jgi:hypothetical protein
MALSYIIRFNEYTFYKEADELVVKHMNDDEYEFRDEWPEDWGVTDEDLGTKIHEEYYFLVQDI